MEIEQLVRSAPESRFRACRLPSMGSGQERAKIDSIDGDAFMCQERARIDSIDGDAKSVRSAPAHS